MLPYYPPQIENGFYIAGFDLTALQEGFYITLLFRYIILINKVYSHFSQLFQV